MGRKSIYEGTREERQRQAKRVYAEKQRALKKGGSVKGKHPKSWVKSLEKKLEAVGETKDEKPSERAGEPFADLPPLDLPASAPVAEEPADAPSSTDGASTESGEAASSEKKKAAKGDSQIFDTEQLELMATQLAHDATMVLGEYASSRGYFAFGEPFAKLAGIAAGVLVKVHATKVGISDEEAAAWVLGGIVGTNGVQAFRASRSEKAQKEKEEANGRARAAQTTERQHAANGTTVDPIQQAQRASEQRAAEGLVRSAGAIV